VFVLVYNLHDTADLFKRYPAAEGRAYALGGLHRFVSAPGQGGC
jgi:hypothetical protein